MEKMYVVGKRHLKNLKEIMATHLKEGTQTTVVELTKEVGCSSDTMQKLLKKLPKEEVLKVLPHYRGYEDLQERLESIQEYIDTDGKESTLTEIANHAGIGETTLSYYISKGYIKYTPKRAKKLPKVDLDSIRIAEEFRKQPDISLKQLADILEVSEQILRNFARREYQGYVKMKKELLEKGRN